MAIGQGFAEIQYSAESQFDRNINCKILNF